MSNGQDAVPTWEGRIKPMFAPYVGCMKSDFVFKKIGRTIDLADYDDVVGNSNSIIGLAVLSAHQHPMAARPI